MSSILTVAIVVLLIIALVDVIPRSADQIRYLPKVGWIILIVLLPLIGSVIWFAAGRARDGRRPAFVTRRSPHLVSVEQDRSGTLADARRHRGDERVSATERELAALDREIAYWEDRAGRREDGDGDAGTGGIANDGPGRAGGGAGNGSSGGGDGAPDGTDSTDGGAGPRAS